MIHYHMFRITYHFTRLCKLLIYIAILNNNASHSTSKKPKYPISSSPGTPAISFLPTPTYIVPNIPTIPEKPYHLAQQSYAS